MDFLSILYYLYVLRWLLQSFLPVLIASLHILSATASHLNPSFFLSSAWPECPFRKDCWWNLSAIPVYTVHTLIYSSTDTNPARSPLPNIFLPFINNILLTTLSDTLLTILNRTLRPTRNNGTPTKCQVSKRQVSKRPVSKRLKRQVYKTSGLQNVRFTKCQIYKTSGLQNVQLQKSIHIYSVLVVCGNPQVLLQPCLQAKWWLCFILYFRGLFCHISS